MFNARNAGSTEQTTTKRKRPPRAATLKRSNPNISIGNLVNTLNIL